MEEYQLEQSVSKSSVAEPQYPYGMFVYYKSVYSFIECIPCEIKIFGFFYTRVREGGERIFGVYVDILNELICFLFIQTRDVEIVRLNLNQNAIAIYINTSSINKFGSHSLTINYKIYLFGLPKYFIYFICLLYFPIPDLDTSIYRFRILVPLRSTKGGLFLSYAFDPKHLACYFFDFNVLANLAPQYDKTKVYIKFVLELERQWCPLCKALRNVPLH